MKRLALVLMLLCTNAYAFIPTEPIGTAYNDGYWYPAGSSYLGPSNKGGFAYGFSLADAYKVSSITGFISGFSDAGFGEYNLSLYQGSVYRDSVPLPSNNLIYTSKTFTATLDGSVKGYEQKTNLNLAAGDYWLDFNGGASGPSIVQARAYGLDGKLARIHNPEPATILLMGGGLMAMFRRRNDSKRAV